MDFCAFLCFYILGILGTVWAQIPLWGACPTVETTPNFDLQRYLGKWYKVEAYFHFFELGLTCVTAEYNMHPSSVPGQPPMLSVRNSGWNWLYGTQTVTDGEAYIPDPIRNPGKLKISFANVTGPSSGIPDADYWILDTDYNNYSVVWSCTAMEIFGASFMNAQTLWILGRTPNLPESTLSRIKDRLRAIGINPSGLGRPSEQGCPGQPGFRDKPPNSPLPDRLSALAGISALSGTANIVPQNNAVDTRSFLFQSGPQFSFAGLLPAMSSGPTQASASENHLSWQRTHVLPQPSNPSSGKFSRKRPFAVVSAPLSIRRRNPSVRIREGNFLGFQSPQSFDRLV